jgi:predicted MFS family arabinose efflux permease
MAIEPAARVSTESNPKESLILALLAGVQFVNILDFMMVMPLGPMFAAGLGMPLSRVPVVAASYTIAAGISGFLGAFFLDRFDRKPALLTCLVGLSVGTALGGFAPNVPMLLAARVIAGAFGGPATSLSLAIVSDTVPAERRGVAIGKVMTAFSVASVFGVPTGLYLAALGGYRLPFFAVGALGAAIAFGVAFVLPSFRGHLAPLEVDMTAMPVANEASGGNVYREAPKRPAPPTFRSLARPRVFGGLGLVALVCIAAFVLIPSIASYLTANLHVPPKRLGVLYMFGGLASFGGTLLGGRLVDRLGAGIVGGVATATVATAVVLGFYENPPILPPWGIFVVFMLGNSFRNVSLSTVQSKIPAAFERARYGSLQSCVQHLASGFAGLLAAKILTENENHELVGIPTVATVSIALSVVVVPWMFFLARAVETPKAPLTASQ